MKVDPDFLPVIYGLIDYIANHFHQEHSVMMNNFNSFATHSRERQQFIEKAEEFIQTYKVGDQDLGINMIVYIKDRVHNHTTKLDMEYAEHLIKKAAKQPILSRDLISVS